MLFRSLDVSTDQLDDRLDLLSNGRKDELVAPHGVVAILALVGLHAIGQEAFSVGRFVERLQDVDCGLALEGGLELWLSPHLFLQRPQSLDGIPVAVARRVLQPPNERLIDAAAPFLQRRAQVEGRRELDRKSTRLNSSHERLSRMPSSA